MKPIEKTDYCAFIGLNPLLSDYFKTYDEADYLLTLIERLKEQNRMWGDCDRDDVKRHGQLIKDDIEIKNAIELLIHLDIVDSRDVHYSPELEVLLYETRSIREYDKEVRAKLWKELKEQGFTRIEKLIATINIVVGDVT